MFGKIYDRKGAKMNNFEVITTKIGGTPLVFIDEFNGSPVYGKLESANPTGSVKDRPAFNMLRRAFEAGIIKIGDTIVEPTSGNTGIGLAYVGREIGFKVVLTMPSSMSRERVELLKSYGAEVVLTDARLGMKGAIDEAKRIAIERNGYMPCQFDNPYNKEIHRLTTAPEIFKDLPTVTDIISPLGSGGTAMGLKEFFVEKGLNVNVYAVEPQNSRVLIGENAHPHKIQGIGANFVPSIVKVEMLDGILSVADEEAYSNTRELKNKYNLFCGISSGASLAAVKKLAEIKKGVYVIILPDSGDRYISTGVFDA